MRISHLTFGQLYKLHSAHNLFRVTLRYHCALLRRWDFFFPTLPRSQVWVSQAEKMFPEVAAQWRKVLNFLTSRELRRALRRAADAQPCPAHPGYAIPFRTLDFFRPEAEEFAYQLAVVTKMYALSCGVQAHIVRNPEQQNFQVVVETTELGAAALLYKTGLPIAELQRICEFCGYDYAKLFWWVPEPANPTWKVNPCMKPSNTPDVYEIAKTMVWT